MLDPYSCPQPVIVIGEDVPVNVSLKYQNPPNLPYDLTDATEIVALFLNADQSVLEKKLSLGQIVIVSAPGGAITILLTSTDTALLAPSQVGAFSNMELRLTVSGKLTIVQFPNSIQIVSKLFPSV